jgi:signal transduction histidine kinase
MNDRVALDQPLPPELVRRGIGVASYQYFPVFSATWLKKRTALFALIIGPLGVLMGIADAVRSDHVLASAWLVLHFWIGGLVLTTAGPALATWVRHQRWPLARERRWVFATLGAGMLISFVVDAVVSSAMEANLASGTAALPPEPTVHGAAALALNIVALFVIYGLVGGGLAIRQFIAEPRRWADLAQQRELTELRARKQALDTHLGVLQAQIEPHFLFNTLAAVRSLVTTNPNQANEAIDALVDYLRATIPRLRDTQLDSNLGQQLEICESYLRLMSIRMGRLTWTVHCAPPLHAIAFPPLLLMTLVENAIKHGVEPKAGNGTIVIDVQRTAAALVVSVNDDGVGLREPLGSGVGLQNVREQLRARYPGHAKFTLTSAAERGTTACIELDLPPS